MRWMVGRKSWRRGTSWCLLAMLASAFVSSAAAIDLGPPPQLAPPEDNLGEFFPVRGAEPERALDEHGLPLLELFPESPQHEWESLEPEPPQFADGLIVYQAEADAAHLKDAPEAKAGWLLPTLAVCGVLLTAGSGALLMFVRRG